MQHTFKLMYLLTVVNVILQSEVVEFLVSVVSEPVNVVSKCSERRKFSKRSVDVASAVSVNNVAN